MKIIKIIFLTLLILFLSNKICSQITIDGTITDADSNPINNALVEIIDRDDTTNYYSATTNESGYFSISNIVTDLEERKDLLPSDFIVLKNYPNPFNPSTIIYYELPKSENIEIKIYDILGREVRTLYNNFHKAGTYTLSWDGRNNWNSPVVAGVYFCRLKTKDNFKVHKMLLLDGGTPNKSFNALCKNRSNSQIEKISSGIFNYSVRISGEDIIGSEFNYLSCSSDTTLSLMVPKILKSVTIGPEGGKLETEDFLLNVPEGAFVQEETLSLAIETDSVSFEEEIFSKPFRVDGIPELYYQNLKMKIKLDVPPADSISIAFGENYADTLLGYEFIDYDYYPAEDSSGYAIANIVSPFTDNSALLKSKNNNIIENTAYEKKLIVVLTSPGAVVSSEGNFKIYYPKSKAIYVPIIDEYLEDAVKVVESLGFTISPHRSILITSNWPVKVKFNKGTTDNKFLQSHYGASTWIQGKYRKENNKDHLIKNWEITINTDNFSESFPDNLRRSLGRDVFKNFIHQDKLFTNDPSEDKWLTHALIIWVLELFPKDDNFIPWLYHYNNLEIPKHLKFNIIEEIFDGIYFNENNTRYLIDHSLAFTALIDYFTTSTEEGDKIIFEIYQNIVSQKSSEDALIETMNQTENFWWPDFFKEYIQGNIYNVPAENFLENISKTIEFNAGDTVKYADETYKDLSAKLFKVNINSDEIKNKTLNFKLGPESLNLDYAKALVFGESFDQLIFLSEGTDFNIRNFQNYNSLLACVVNSGNEPPYTGTSNIDLDIKVTDDLAFKYCDIRLAVIEMHDTLEGVWSPGWYTKGTFKNNIFDGIINTEKQGGNSTGSIQIIMDENQKILSLDVMAYNSDPTGFSSQWGFTAGNVPPTENEPYLLVHSYQGYDVCKYVNSIYAKYTEVDGSVTEIRNFKCEDESLLHIKFHNWD